MVRMLKSKIGIVTSITIEQNPVIFKVDRVYVNSDYIEAIEKVDATPIMIPVVLSDESLDIYIDICDGFLFSGGIDINPIYYNQDPHKKLGTINSKLDEFQLKLMKKVLKSEKPFLAICRGLQILNVVCGGTLYQDLDEITNNTIQHQQSGERYNLIHKVYFEKNSILHGLYGKETYVNSFHHQSIHELGSNLLITGRASDGVIEAVEVKNYNFGLGVQWHPEMMFSHFEYVKPLFESLVSASLKQ
jgi:putative glutamine amidotransferase